MKPFAIILIILVLAAVVGIGWLYFSANLTVTFDTCIATDGVTQVRTSNGMTFDSAGLHIDRDGADDVSQDLLDNPQTGEALEIVRESGLNDAERAAYEGFWDRVSIEATKKAYMDKAIAERDAANAERDAANAERDAATEKLRQSARKMKAKGFSADDIAELTGLTVDEIKAL